MTTLPHQDVYQTRALASYASAYAAAGLCVLPAVRRGDEKRVALPVWKEYQTRLPSAQELRSWFDGANAAEALCLVCGSVSGHLEMVDFDHWDGGGSEAFESWREAVDAAVPGLTERLVMETTPAGGRHVIYRCEGPVSGNTKLAARRIEVDSDERVVVGSKEYAPRRDKDGRWTVTVTLIETRGEGGLFLCDPSPGYILIQGHLSEPPDITADERDILLGCAWALDEAPAAIVGDAPQGNGSAMPNGSPLRPGDDFNKRGDPREILQRHGWTLVRPGENEHWCRPGKSGGTSATLKGGVFYVFSTNAAPFEGQKAYAPFGVYGLLEHHGDYTAAASVLAREGYGLRAATTVTAPPRTDAHIALKSGATSQLTPRPVPVGDLVSSYPALRSPVIYGLLREGETMNVIAAPKTGKSWLTLDLAIAVATGRPWLGKYETVPGDVLIIDNELHRETSAHRLPKVAQARGVAMDSIGQRICVDNLRGRLQDIFTLAPYFEALEPGRFKVIVLDAFYRFMPQGGDENDNGTMSNIYNLIDSFADRLGCCFVLIHHASKGNQSGKSVTDVGAGAGAQSRATDTHLVLRPHEDEGVVVLDAAVRSWAPVDPACLRWSFPVWTLDPTLDPGSLKGERGKRSKDRSKAADLDEGRSPPWTVERFVDEFVSDQPVSLAELRERVKTINDLPVRRAEDFIRIAESKHLVERRKLPGRGGPLGFVLPGSEPEGDAS